MALKLPGSINECVYFTRRTFGEGNNGKIMAWVYKMDCPKCRKAKMGKPKDETGHKKIRAKIYVCPECAYTESKEVHEPKLTVEVKYACPFCGNVGEATTPYKRKSFEGVPSYVFECGKCKKKIGITKKMKAGKKKGAAEEDDDGDDD
ncbi:hypothetical protein COV19_00215 [Candidatus Woesearchaeota archaeon CG10_big_fil_rev_8_21_14_0_10_44_13]|nr:MAG: hypothetical protein COV19_00215 [Candidatus Woesearchaeota archaeon CG10_big_fil_rev_8_21_14_0_10_44_13]